MALFIILLALICFLNVRIVSLVYSRKNNLRKMTSSTQQGTCKTHRRVLKTIIYLLLIFLICSCPGYVIYIMISLGKTMESSQFNKSMMIFGQYLFTFQAMINPLVYATAASEYKKTLKRFFEVIFKRRQSTLSVRKSTVSGSIEMTGSVQ